jgi:Protein of unknown function (DUF4235)
MSRSGQDAGRPPLVTTAADSSGSAARPAGAKTIIKLLFYKPVDQIAGMVSGLLAGLIFDRVWTLINRKGAPKPTDERRGWGEILLAATLHGAVFALVKAAVDRGAAEGTRRFTGIWPGDEGQQPDESG